MTSPCEYPASLSLSCLSPPKLDLLTLVSAIIILLIDVLLFNDGGNLVPVFPWKHILGVLLSHAQSLSHDANFVLQLYNRLPLSLPLNE